MKKPAFNPRNHKIYVPKNSNKYIGKSLPICRSSWEESFCRWLDANPSVSEWTSEALAIPYYDPIQKRRRRYFPDFLVTINNKDTFIVEIKPSKETQPPRRTKNKSQKTMLYEEKTYETNKAKWEAAQLFCQKMGFTFKIITEKQLLK